jgi:hypothetical protein
MKSRLLACAAAGLACTFPGLAGAQVSVPLDQITAHVRAAGLQPLSRPMVRGVVYYVRASSAYCNRGCNACTATLRSAPRVRLRVYAQEG